MSPEYWAVIPAAGTGQRFGGETPKQYLPLARRTVIEWAARTFLRHDAVSGIVFALADDDTHFGQLAFPRGKDLWTVTGGESRAESVRRALDFLSDRANPRDWVLVHDAARPCLDSADLQNLISGLADQPAGGLLACRITDTVKQGDAEGRVTATRDRKDLWRALTPQMFRLGLLREAMAAGDAFTDEASAMESAGHPVRLIRGRPDNIKITTAEDLELARCILGARGE